MTYFVNYVKGSVCYSIKSKTMASAILVSQQPIIVGINWFNSWFADAAYPLYTKSNRQKIPPESFVIKNVNGRRPPRTLIVLCEITRHTIDKRCVTTKGSVACWSKNVCVCGGVGMVAKLATRMRNLTKRNTKNTDHCPLTQLSLNRWRLSHRPQMTSRRHH